MNFATTPTNKHHQPKTTSKKTMKPQIDNRPFAGLRDILISANKPNVHTWKEDGVDHINLGMGTTRLGANLSLSGVSSFKHSRLGRFKTLFGFWNYVANVEQDDRYRVLNDKEIRAFNRQKDIKRTPRRVRNFIAIILDAQWQRITGNERLLTAVKESSLPFDCYKLNGEVRERTSYEYWFVPAMEEMRKCIKEGREFNVRPYMQDRGFDLYVDLIANPAPPIPTPSPVEEANTALVQTPQYLMHFSTSVEPDGYAEALSFIDTNAIDLDTALLDLMGISISAVNGQDQETTVELNLDKLAPVEGSSTIKLFDPNQVARVIESDTGREVITAYSDELGRIKVDLGFDLDPGVVAVLTFGVVGVPK